MPSRLRLLLPITFLFPPALFAGVPDVVKFVEFQCAECHDAETKKGSLDLSALKWQPDDQANFDRWTGIFDRVERGEMPPENEPRPEPDDLSGFLKSLS